VRVSLREVVTLDLVPVDLTQARAFVASHHRHNEAAQGWRFGVGLAIDGELRGVAMVGRPVAPALAAREPRTVEITRVCTLGDRNANSRLYGAACRMAASGGYVSAISYTLEEESGASLRAAGFTCEGAAGARTGQTWNSPSRPRVEENLFGETRIPEGPKLRWRRWLRTSLAWIPSAWSRDTSASPDEWTPENPALGQCAVTALVVQELLGGELRRARVNGVSHYWNVLPNGRRVDLTVQQFGAEPLTYEPNEAGERRERAYVLGFRETAERYRRLVARGLAA